MCGLPLAEAHDAALDGRLVLGGCLQPEDPPNWQCSQLHQSRDTDESAWEQRLVEILIAYAYRDLDDLEPDWLHQRRASSWPGTTCAGPGFGADRVRRRLVVGGPASACRDRRHLARRHGVNQQDQAGRCAALWIAAVDLACHSTQKPSGRARRPVRASSTVAPSPTSTPSRTARAAALASTSLGNDADKPAAPATSSPSTASSNVRVTRPRPDVNQATARAESERLAG